MKKIASFTVNHLKLLRGLYVSRIDYVNGNPITTYDIRMKAPNVEPVLHTAEMHTIEHLAATYLRNHPDFSKDIIYFGPMGCRTGFYLILSGERQSNEIAPLVIETFEFIEKFDEPIPGASAKDCGNYLDMNLPMARYEASKFLKEVLYSLTMDNLTYPE